VAAVAVTPKTASLLVGQLAPLAASARDAAGNAVADRVAAWSSSDSLVAAVTADGIVTGRVAGTAVVFAAIDGVRDSAAITVRAVPVASVDVAPAAVEVVVGARHQLAAVPRDSAGQPLVGRVVAWSTTDAAIATVDSTGAVTSRAPGVATVSATSEGRSGAATVTVRRAPVAAVVLTPRRDTLPVGATRQFSAESRDAGGNLLAGRDLAWSVSDAAVASVSPTGVLTARAAGTAVLRVVSEGASDSAQIVVGGAPAPTRAAPDTVRLVTFGDSNLDLGYRGNDATIRARAYVSNSASNRLRAGEAHSEYQVTGKVERLWRSAGGLPIRTVNHAIWGTSTGGGSGGGPDRSHEGAPNARTVVDGVTRFEAEVLGRGFPWHGGESYGRIERTSAFTPDARSFVIIVLGSNDAYHGMPSDRTIANLQWMLERWTAAGLRADHLVLTTVSPRADNGGGEPIARINDGIRDLARRTGAGLIDVAHYTSTDNGRSWRSSSHRVDGAHWSESVRDWIAQELVAYMRPRTP
jgi:hypothetical protein